MSTDPRITRTCRFCLRDVDRVDGAWLDLAAGYDDENGDGIWREVCDQNDTSAAPHLPADCACGWVNDWTDSGDRGYAAADHERECGLAS